MILELSPEELDDIIDSCYRTYRQAASRVGYYRGEPHLPQSPTMIELNTKKKDRYKLLLKKLKGK